MHQQHNDLVHEAMAAAHRVQQSWHCLCEAYQAVLSELKYHAPTSS